MTTYTRIDPMTLERGDKFKTLGSDAGSIYTVVRHGKTGDYVNDSCALLTADQLIYEVKPGSWDLTQYSNSFYLVEKAKYEEVGDYLVTELSPYSFEPGDLIHWDFNEYTSPEKVIRIATRGDTFPEFHEHSIIHCPCIIIKNRIDGKFGWLNIDNYNLTRYLYVPKNTVKDTDFWWSDLKTKDKSKLSLLEKLMLEANK